MTQQRPSESDEEYEKRKRRVKLAMMGSLAGGGIAISVVTAAILYEMDTFNVDASDLRTIDNAGSDGATSDGDMYGSNHIYLDGTTQSVDIPLGYTLGSELVTDGTFDTPASWNTQNNWQVSGGTGNTSAALTANAWIYQGSALPTFTLYVATLDVVVTAGSCQALNSDTEAITSSGSYTISTNTGTTTFKGVLGQSGFDGSVDNLSIKEATHTTLGLIYYDVATKAHKMVTSFDDIVYNMTDSFSNLVTLSVIPTAGDLTYLDANPEAIARLVDGETVAGLSFVLADIQAFYTGNRGLIDETVVGTLNATSYKSVNQMVADVNASYTDSSAVTPTLGTGWVDNLDGTYTITNAAGSSDLTFPVTFVGGHSLLSFDVTSSTTGSTPLVLNMNSNAIVVNAGTGRFSCYAFDDPDDIRNRDNVIIRARVGCTMTVGDFLLNSNMQSEAEITNYASTCRTNLDLTNYGASNFLYTQDATGRWNGMHTAGEIAGGSDGRNIDINMTIPYNHVVTKDIDKIEGSLTSCTITYADTTTLVVP